MIDPTLVTSGFDTETLLSERYVAYVLLAQIEAGLLSPRVRIVRPAEPPDDPGLDLDVTIHPPTAYERLYEPHPGGELPDARAGAFEVDILFDHPSGADVRIGLFVTVVDNRTGRRLEGGLDLFTTLSLGFQRDGALEKNHRLALEVVDIGGIVVNLAESFGADATSCSRASRPRSTAPSRSAWARGRSSGSCCARCAARAGRGTRSAST
jgi:hypothetical protein